MRLHRVTGNSETQSRLAALGLIPGAELQLVGGSERVPLIVGLKSGGLMLGPELARHLWVEQLSFFAVDLGATYIVRRAVKGRP